VIIAFTFAFVLEISVQITFIKHTTNYYKMAGKAIRQRDEKGTTPFE